MKNLKINRHPAAHVPQQGFTLLEVLVAVLILALSVTAILYQFSVGMEIGGKARDTTEAVLHAKNKLEELKAFIEDETNAPPRSGAFDDGYSWETGVNILELPENNAGENDMLQFELLELSVTVRWEAGGQQRQVELTTLKAVKKKERS